MTLRCTLPAVAGALLLAGGCATSPFDLGTGSLLAAKTLAADRQSAIGKSEIETAPANVQFSNNVWLGDRPIPLTPPADAIGSATPPDAPTVPVDALPSVTVGPLSFQYASVMDVLGLLLNGTGIRLVALGDTENELLRRPQNVHVVNLKGPLDQIVAALGAQMGFAFEYTARTRLLVVSTDMQRVPATNTPGEKGIRSPSSVGRAGLALSFPTAEETK